MLLPVSLLTLVSSLVIAAASNEAYSESLSLIPLVDGKVHSSFVFETTAGSSHLSRIANTNATVQHHTVLSPILSTLIQTYRVSTFSLSLSSGRWSPHWPSLRPSIAPSGIELTAWLELLEGESELDERKRWSGFVGALGGLFCAGVAKATEGGVEDSPEWGWDFNGEGDALEHRFYHLLLPRLSATCTESLTPFISLLPCASYAGLATLLNPHKLFDGDWTLIQVDYAKGSWKFEIGSVVDPVRQERLNGGMGRREFSFSSIYDRKLEKACPVAETSLVRLAIPESAAIDQPISVEPKDSVRSESWQGREWATWDVSQVDSQALDVRMNWEHEQVFRPPHPTSLPQPKLTARRLLTGYGQERGRIGIELVAREALIITWSETWPWWLRVFTGGLDVQTFASDPSPFSAVVGNAKILNFSYTPSIPRKRPTTLQLRINLPKGSITRLTIPYEAAYLLYTEYPPDAHRGFEIPSATIFYSSPDGSERTQRISTESTLISLPTPDFSMPYNVIILTSTVIALFFGSVMNPLVRKWLVVDLEEGEKQEDNVAPKQLEI